ncbi:3-deoxy-D-manno-octulosonic acid kinase [Psychromonas sp. RZ22]|uniref:3-deoxy-D-manno-octulosonic acid kinase n=1 Tax=Psychromonas algarum TaxID=2555643 RepID=UPI0010676C52|nr:3-deoxy-D-manno-octulosonic acid kinase [Psychromonas sp. RZ22]TEW56619.1 3-deoxy-D-manno-octulosonic acid kinase [Psychromonas sp. RZ22]
MVKVSQKNKVYIIYDDDLLGVEAENSFSVHYWQQKNSIIGSAQGRGTTWFIQLDKLQAALRHYRRGGLFGKLISDTYLFTGYQNTRSIAEFHLLAHLQKKGVNVPAPIAAKVQRNGLFYQADLLSEKIPNATDLVDILQIRELSQPEYFHIGQEVKKLHQAQVNHTDLNIHNILLDSHGKVWIIDFDKCYQQVGDNWKGNNLQRLLRSFRKELKKRDIHWSEADWLLLMAGYNNINHNK